MKTEEINRNFSKTIAIWDKALDGYTNSMFSSKPAEDSWSIGQVCQHLILRTQGVFKLIDKCLKEDTNASEQKNDLGTKAIKNNVLSEVKIKLPLSVQPTPAQPENKDVIKAGFKEIKSSFARLAKEIEKSKSKGKEKHPVLGFLDAKEWLQVIEMHLRHHLRQKENIDAFLQSHSVV